MNTDYDAQVENDSNYADYPSMTIELPSTPSIPYDDSVTMGSPAVSPSLEAKDVTVYALSINPVSSMGDSPIVAFDVIFSVNCTCPESGRAETYQVVKRIGVDKLKLANTAKSSTPISIVEAKATPAPTSFLSTDRARVIAGLK